MAILHPDLSSAIDAILATASDQSQEFRDRLRRLIENISEGNVPDTDVRDIIELAHIGDIAEE